MMEDVVTRLREFVEWRRTGGRVPVSRIIGVSNNQ